MAATIIYLLAVGCMAMGPFTTNAMFDDSECGKTKGCIREPANCAVTECRAIASWSRAEDDIQFELQAADTEYISIGFSNDKAMGDDPCIDCVFRDDKIDVLQSYNEGQSNMYLEEADRKNGIVTWAGTRENRIIYCNLTRQIEVAGKDRISNLANNYYLFLARGEMLTDGNKQKHDRTPLVSAQAVNVKSDTDALSASSNSNEALMKSHIGLMLAAWAFLAGTGLFLARFYKGAWPDHKLCGMKVWFPLHRIIMVFVLACTAAGFVVVFVKTDGEYSNLDHDSNSFAKAHAPLGIAVMALVIINPIVSIFRCAPDNSKRSIFNIVHWLIGTVAHVASAWAICIALRMDASKAYVPDSLFWLMIGHIAFHVVMFILMELHRIIGDRKEMKKVDAMEMQANGPTEVVYSSSRVWGAGFKYAMLVIYTTVVTTIYVVMLVLMIVKDDD